MKKQLVIECHVSKGGEDAKLLTQDMADIYLKFISKNGLELVSYSKAQGCL